MGRTKISFLEHTADIKFKVEGESEEDVFSGMVEALGEYMGAQELTGGEMEQEIKSKGNSMEELLINLLNDLILLRDSEYIVPKSCVVRELRTIGKEWMVGITLTGVKITGEESLRDVKAATWHDFVLKEGKEGWVAEVVVDI